MAVSGVHHLADGRSSHDRLLADRPSDDSSCGSAARVPADAVRERTCDSLTSSRHLLAQHRRECYLIERQEYSISRRRLIATELVYGYKFPEVQLLPDFKLRRGRTDEDVKPRRGLLPSDAIVVNAYARDGKPLDLITHQMWRFLDPAAWDSF